MDIDQWNRVLNMTLAGLNILLLLIRTGHRWATWEPPMRLLAQAQVALLVAVLWATVENFQLHTTASYRLPVISVGLLWILVALVVVLRHHRPSDTP